MSLQLQLAFVSPQLIIAAALALALVAILVVLTLRRTHRAKTALIAWDAAADELGIQFVPNGSDYGPVARGRVNDHVVSISPVVRNKKRQRVTRYSVKFDAPEAPDFNLVRRINESTPLLDTGNPKFDAVVAVRTDQPELLTRFLTDPRRAAILRLLQYFPAAQITNHDAHLLTTGIEHNKDRLVDSICHLVAAAETFDRATIGEEPETLAATPDDNAAMAEPSAMRFDEISVLDDLFNSDRDDAAIDARFEQAYQGREVKWTGEVLRVGGVEPGMQRVVAFVGSANGTSPDSGRVVAMTSLKPEPGVVPGDVVSFSGALANLDISQRLFHVV